MKICVIAPTYMPARRANTIQVAKMTQAFCALGHEVCLVVPSSKAQDWHKPMLADWDEWRDHYGLQHAFPVIWLAANPKLRRFDYGLRAFLWARQWGAELVYTRLPQAAAFTSFWGLPTIFEIHDFPYGLFGKLLFRLFLKGRGARRLVVITKALLEDLALRFGIPQAPPFSLIAPDGVDLPRYANLPAPKEARRVLVEKGVVIIDRFTAGYSGHLYAGRGVQLMLEMAKQLTDITFLIMGGEPQDVVRVHEEVKSIGLDNVILTGFVPNNELPLYQASCDVLLMPYQEHVSASSGGDIAKYLSPMKMFEYLACGRPILSSDLPVLKEVLSSENAILLPPRDLAAWVTLSLIHISEPTRPY